MPFDGTERTPTLADMKAWLEVQALSTEYNYMKNHDCLIYRYLKARGYPVANVGGSAWFDRSGYGRSIQYFNKMAWRYPRTYAGALERVTTELGEAKEEALA